MDIIYCFRNGALNEYRKLKKETGNIPAIWFDITIQDSATQDGVIKCKHFPRYWPFVRGIHRSPVHFDVIVMMGGHRNNLTEMWHMESQQACFGCRTHIVYFLVLSSCTHFWCCQSRTSLLRTYCTIMSHIIWYHQPDEITSCCVDV